MSANKRSLAAVAITLTAGAIVGGFSLLSPNSAQAVWPFSRAQAADEDVPVLHDPSLHLLTAALNSDPNPLKGGADLTLSEGSALMANSGPDGTLPEKHSSVNSSNASNGEISVYTVRNGDSISGIADHFGVSVSTILWANDLTVRSTIRPGMTLVILPISGVKHTVKNGETLSSIAATYKASAGEIATFNGLDADATVVVGSNLVIPGGERTSPVAPAKKAVAKTSAAKATTKIRADLGTAAAGGYFANPVPGGLLTQGIHGNNGVDIGAPAGTPIHAAAAGIVIISKGDGAWNGGYGSYVVISHPNGSQTLYSHMSKDIASVGETVAKGDVIGYVGNTGAATGMHLHFEVRGAKNPITASCSVMSKCY